MLAPYADEATQAIDTRRNDLLGESVSLPNAKATDESKLSDFVSSYLSSVGVSLVEARESGSVNAWNQFDKWKDRHW